VEKPFAELQGMWWRNRLLSYKEYGGETMDSKHAGCVVCWWLWVWSVAVSRRGDEPQGRMMNFLARHPWICAGSSSHSPYVSTGPVTAGSGKSYSTDCSGRRRAL